ncbi:MAG: type II toxin-antitoxin system HicA family toxin [Candidatus Yonathbacteria bacterium]|nr:type II toxin-antitoxin system HicA family toxin [Candidatus Yonathbacteria bacterium]
MPKLPALTSKKLLKMLAVAGFEVDHITGSHYILHRIKDDARVTVPFHRKDIPKGTLHTIMKSAGLL